MNQKKAIVSGLSWKFAERITAQAITFFVSIIIARLLEPTAYGQVSLVMIFISIANVLVTSGFGNSLIQKKDADDLDFSSVFYAQLLLSFLLYFLIFLIAPYVELYYGTDFRGLGSVLRVLGLRIPLSAINNVQQSYVSRRMIFKKFFVATLFGTVLSAVVGIYMAYAGFGVWALVFQYLTNTTVDTIVLFITMEWRPKCAFSFERLKPLMNYGWKLLCTDLLNSVLNNFRSLIIGKAYSSEDLAYYNKSEQFPSLIVTNINASLQSVLFPAMSNVQNDHEEVKHILRKTISTGAFVIFPMVYGFMAVADSVVILLLTEKWAECIPYVQVFCISYSLRIISTSCAQSIKAIGRSDVYMKSVVIYKILELISIVITAMISVKAIAIGTVINAVIIVVIQFYCNNKYIGYTFREISKDMLPIVTLTAIMTASVWCLRSIGQGIGVLLLRILTGAIIYIGGSFLLKVPALHDLIGLVKTFVTKKIE